MKSLKATTFMTGVIILGTLGCASAHGWDSSVPNDCSWGCKLIPDDNHVLRSVGSATQNTLKMDKGNLKVLAWNLHKGVDPEFKQDFAALTKDKDLVLLSEVVLDDAMPASMLDVTGFGWEMATSFLLKHEVPTGTAIGSAALAHNVHFKRTQDLEPVIKSPKAITLAEYEIPGSKETLLVASIHGINWSGDEALRRQLQQVEPEFEAHQGPIIFAGDFNTKNSNRIQIAADVLAKAGMKRVPWKSFNQSKQLDDAFTRGFKVNSAEYDYSVVGHGSDHPAILLDVSLL